MAFSLKTWVNRISEYPNRRKLTHEDGSTELVTVARAEGQISEEGNAFSAEEMNDLENRIKGGFDEINQSLPYIISGRTRIAVDGNNLKQDTINVSLKTGYSIASITIYGVTGAGEANVLNINKNNFSYFIRNNGVNSTTFNVCWLITAVYTS